MNSITGFLIPSLVDAPKSITDRCTFQPLQEITTPKPEEPTKGFIGESKLHITYNVVDGVHDCILL